MTNREFFEQVLRLTNTKTLDALDAASVIRTFRAGELILRAGDPVTEVSFLISGALQSFYFDAAGHEITDCFAARFGTPALPSFLEEKARSPINLEALTATELLCVPVDVALSHIAQNTACARVYTDQLHEAFNRHWQIKQMVSQHTATERYRWFLGAFPELDGVAKDRTIASFLGMTPVTLSRIKRTVRGEQPYPRPAAEVPIVLTPSQNHCRAVLFRGALLVVLAKGREDRLLDHKVGHNRRHGQLNEGDNKRPRDNQ